MSNGHIITNTPIAVDCWNKSSITKICFLSHCHGDHIVGLDSKWRQNLYCTPMTKKLIIQIRKIPESLVTGLETGENHIIPLDAEGNHTMTVGVIDAHHCPGAAMFLFHGYFGTILYTADFRYNSEMFEYGPLRSISTVDQLYLDNTFCSPSCNFPSQLQARKAILDIIDKHPDYRIYIAVKKLGKEDLLVHITKYLNTKIVVDVDKLELLEILGMVGKFTTNRQDGRVFTVPLHKITKSFMEYESSVGPTIAIVPTAIFHGVCSVYDDVENVFVVPYSDHSSYVELHSFVRRVQPSHIIPIVTTNKGPNSADFTSRKDMSCFKQHKPVSQTCVKCEIPKSVQRYMSVTKSAPLKRKTSVTLFSNYGQKRKKIARGVQFDSPEKD